MRQAPVKASAFVKLPPEVQTLLVSNGAVPINDVYLPLWDCEDKIILLYGGYGSGKSVFIADLIIDRLMNSEYFRCFYGRKVYDTIRDSIFKTITDRIEERGLTSQFIYSTSDNSSMRIRSRANGNLLIPFGADKSYKLKSIKDPSHIICEEFDQFTLDDFGVLLSRLRKQGINTQLIGAFNTTTVKPDHWIKEVLFSEKGEEILGESITITKLFCNYTDNYFMNHKEYEQTLRLAAGFDEQKFREIADGEWGAERNEMAFCYTFNREKHTRATKVNPNLELKLSFDFNTNPISCMVAQDYDNKVDIIELIKLPNSNIYRLCEYIKMKYWGYLMLVTGDATGRATSAITSDNRNYYQVIKSELELGDGQMRQPSINPNIEENKVLVNAAFHILDISIDPENAKSLIFDLVHARILPDGKLDKGDRKDPTKQLDALDCFRYYLNTYFKHILKNN